MSPQDCNSKECQDCACINGVCKCADGWGGSHCSKPFCHNRTDCSEHGNCVVKSAGITCSCDSGYTGKHCETIACDLKCKHGGIANAKCTKCEGCLGAWYGPNCSAWDDTISLAELRAKFMLITNQSQKKLDSQLPLKPLCKQHEECLG
jgi:hypothetical protein